MIVCELEKIEALGFCDELSVVQKAAVVSGRPRGGHYHLRSLRSGRNGLDSPAQFFATTGELAAKLGHQSGSALVIRAIESPPRHGRDHQRDDCNRDEDGDREQDQQPAPEPHGFSEIQTLLS